LLPKRYPDRPHQVRPTAPQSSCRSGRRRTRRTVLVDEQLHAVGCNGISRSATASAAKRNVTRYYGNFEVDAIGEPTVVGGGDEFIFSTPERATTPAVADGISLVKMEKVDDTWLVSAHRFLGEGEGSG
jgi:hypothetical protein